MADHAHEFISRRQRVVGPSALICQVRVGVVAFAGKKRDVVGTFLAKGLVRSGSLVVKSLVLLRPLAHNNLGGRLVGHLRRQLSIHLGPSCRKNLVGA